MDFSLAIFIRILYNLNKQQTKKKNTRLQELDTKKGLSIDHWVKESNPGQLH